MIIVELELNFFLELHFIIISHRHLNSQFDEKIRTIRPSRNDLRCIFLWTQEKAIGLAYLRKRFSDYSLDLIMLSLINYVESNQ